MARIGLQVAEALEYANRQGVLHRDVKPSNLLLDPKGNVWVADFGLAKAADAEDITHSGDIVGTVRYMAPERFAGKCDARSDVYALGLTLYELLALRPAFEASDRHELMRRVMSEEPERLRELVPHLPRDLETIVQKAIDREPARRYPTAAALAEDLQRFLDDKPIQARRVSAAEQAWRWARRNPAVASLAAGLLLALVAGLAGVTWQWRKAVANLGAAEAANRKAQARFDLAMEAVRAFTNGASEDVILKEKALEGLRKKLLGQSRSFYDKLRVRWRGRRTGHRGRRWPRRCWTRRTLYAKVDAPAKALDAYRQSLALRAALVRERPGDPAARRDLGRSLPGARRAALYPGRVRRGAGRDGPRAECSSRWPGSTPATAAPGGWRPSATSLEGATPRCGPARGGAVIAGASAGTLRGPGPGQPPVHPADRRRRADRVSPGPRDHPGSNRRDLP